MRDIIDLKNPLYIANDERGLIVGATGSGKSYLAKEILRSKHQLIVIDVKGDFSLPGRKAVRLRTLNDLRHWRGNQRGEFALFQPHPEDADNLDFWEEVFKILFYKRLSGGTLPFVYIDEIYLVVLSPKKPPRYLKAIYCVGRGLKRGVLAGTQRPRGIPVFMRSECNRFICFRLNVKDDLKTMAEQIGDDLLRHPPKGHRFWFRHTSEEHPKMFILAK